MFGLCECNGRNIPGHLKRARTCLASRAEAKNRYCNENNDLPQNPCISEVYQQCGKSYVP